VLIALGATLWVLEEFIPRPLPWLKPGFANIATLAAIYLLSPWDGLIVAIGRVFLGGLLLGRLGSAGFIISLGASVSSALTMALLKLAKLPFSIYGVSVSGAVVHGIAQLTIAGILVYNLSAIYYLIPWISLPAVFTGVIVAFLTGRFLVRVTPVTIY